MDNYREKIVRIVERELKRTEEYQQRRDEYGNEEYILGCIMVKGDAFPKEVIAHAFVEDMGLELQFPICRTDKIPLGTKGRTSILSYREYVRPAELHSQSAEENCPTENVSSLRSVKGATLPCDACASIPCGLAVRKRF